MSETPTCCTGWKQVTDDCPVCGPDGPCIEEPKRVKHSRSFLCRLGMHRWRFFEPLDFLAILICERCSRCGKKRQVMLS